MPNPMHPRPGSARSQSRSKKRPNSGNSAKSNRSKRSRRKGTKYTGANIKTQEEINQREKEIEAAFTELRRVLALALAGKKKQEQYAKEQMEKQYN